MQKLSKASNWTIERLTDFLSSTIGFWIAFIVPLAVIPMPESIKQIENILSSNWIQLWALFGMSIISARAVKHAKANHDDIKAIHRHLGIGEK